MLWEAKTDDSWLSFLHKFATLNLEDRERCFTKFCLLDSTQWAKFQKVAVLQEHASRSLGSEEFDGPSVDEDILTKALIVRNSNSMITSAGQEALFLQCSKLNHSCVPNARFTIGADGVCVLTAIGDIAKGTELCLSYLGHDRLLQSTRQRRFYLRNNYFFDCNCRRCVADDFCRVILCPECGKSAVCRGKKITSETSTSEDYFTCESGHVTASATLRASGWLQKEVDLEAECMRVARAVSRSSLDAAQLRDLLTRCKVVLGGKHWATCRAARALMLALESRDSQEYRDVAGLWTEFVTAAFEPFSKRLLEALMQE